MALSTGTKAPDFTLKTKNAEGLQDIKLSDQFGKGKTVLLFFPLAFTPVCQDELCSVSGALQSYKDLNAMVYGISVDSPFAQEAFANAFKITVPLLSDFNRDVCQAYDVCYPELIGFKGVAKRSAFVIDESGTIVYSESHDDPHDLPNFEAIQKALS